MTPQGLASNDVSVADAYTGARGLGRVARRCFDRNLRVQRAASATIEGSVTARDFTSHVFRRSPIIIASAVCSSGECILLVIGAPPYHSLVPRCSLR